ncbi:zf-HC2 domain-containing protein [Streptomyces lunaelactis]|uniref:anti-sigma factor family protein n=1 Tax=Streptomyces lunaelactis TaxID=1535768 RepID=UPI001585C192|nr:zf-HC2 domain-containing protein [Streptomyces lunaelactis]NUK21173.1 zf-HC2 domain-containing protein [Streptomyces lunaelactis]NUK50164.1 zf-HC2 domain-containing protein [Streptomyces lunaelactis]NUK57319.1 zf-HC2 domain-containing protein [Streptomyces lunaelactis]NUK64524.1 zf-HC2 domain-containing protein [Streptomyces lunaelactis]NUK77742.1 zf-HC2 domain-containing protein [Streptomyces lunaelactis]
MSVQQRHRDVAAYALGVLEPADAFRFEEHLSGCVACAVRLSDFTAVATSLAELAGPGRIDARPSQGLLERLTGEVDVMRRRSRRRRLQLVAAAAALIVALPAAAVALQDGRSAAGQQIVAKDATTGVTAAAAVEDRTWGTSVALRLSRLTGPRTCRLVAIGKDGIEHPVLTWSVPAGGYGFPGSPGHEEPLDIEGGTDLPSADIGRWEVRTLDGQRLISLTG